MLTSTPGMDTSPSRSVSSIIGDFRRMQSDTSLLLYADDLARDVLTDIQAGTLLRTFDTSDAGFPGIDLGPGTISVVGGLPSAGKTAFALQLLNNALENHPDLNVVVANAETMPKLLMARCVSRESGLPFDSLRDWADLPDRPKTAEDALTRGVDRLAGFGRRLAFLTMPCSVSRIEQAVADADARLVVLDYVQKVAADAQAARDQVSEVMSVSRELALGGNGRALLVLSALNRSSQYDGNRPGIGSFRDSSEIEYNADSAYLLTAPATDGRPHVLSCLKNRHGRKQADLRLTFDADRQTFRSAGVAA